ncbi:MAG: PQQ-binding-like beta-propeller repeat protein [Ginsengibacter sp.]
MIKLFFLTTLTIMALLASQYDGTKEIARSFARKTFAGTDVPGPLDDTLRAMGKRIFYTTCYSCHKDTIGNVAPGYSVMSSMTPRAVFASMDNGKMRTQAAKLSEQERKAVAEWLTNSELRSTVLAKEAYTSFSIRGNSEPAFDYSGWGGNMAGTGFRSAEQAGISLSNINSLQLKWAFAFPDATIVRSKPAVIDDWLIVGSQFGDLFAINRKTGKPGWHFAASAAIRGAIVIQKQKKSITAFFADFSTNVYAIDVKTGKQLWYKRAGIDAQSATTGSVAVYEGKVFVPITSTEVGAAMNGDYNCCFSTGGVVALDAMTGKQIWQHRIIVGGAKETGKKKNGKSFYGPSGAPVWCSPTIDSKRGLVYIGTGENYTYPTTNTSDAIQALDMKTGKLVWNFQATSGDAYNTACPVFINCPEKSGPDFDFGMAPILVKRKDGKDILVAGQKSGVVYALSPADGKLIWQTRIGKGGKLGGIHWGMATDGENVYATNADNLIAIDKSDSMLKPSTGIYALDLINGKVIWETPTPGCKDKKNCLPFNSAAPAVIPGVVFAGSLDGHIRGYATKDGKIVWDFDTAKGYDIINGIKANGGAIDGPAPVIADGMLFVNSGYGMFGQIPGNVLLAFGVDGR